MGESTNTSIADDLRRWCEALKEYSAHVALAWQLQDGIGRVADSLEDALRGLEALDWMPVDHPNKSALEREQTRRLNQLKSLRSRLAFGEALLRKIKDGENQTRTRGMIEPIAAALVASTESDIGIDGLRASRDIAELLRPAAQATEMIYTSVLQIYFKHIILSETKMLWEHRESLRRSVLENVPREWVELRESLWWWWASALTDAGLELYEPKPGEPLDYILHEVAASDEEGDGASGQYVEAVREVRVPGLRWPYRDLLLAPALVAISRNASESDAGVLAEPLGGPGAMAAALDTLADYPGSPIPESSADALHGQTTMARLGLESRRIANPLLAEADAEGRVVTPDSLSASPTASPSGVARPNLPANDDSEAVSLGLAARDPRADPLSGDIAVASAEELGSPLGPSVAQEFASVTSPLVADVMSSREHVSGGDEEISRPRHSPPSGSVSGRFRQRLPHITFFAARSSGTKASNARDAGPKVFVSRFSRRMTRILFHPAFSALLVLIALAIPILGWWSGVMVFIDNNHAALVVIASMSSATMFSLLMSQFAQMHNARELQAKLDDLVKSIQPSNGNNS